MALTHNNSPFIPSVSKSRCRSKQEFPVLRRAIRNELRPFSNGELLLTTPNIFAITLKVTTARCAHTASSWLLFNYETHLEALFVADRVDLAAREPSAPAEPLVPRTVRWMRSASLFLSHQVSLKRSMGRFARWHH